MIVPSLINKFWTICSTSHTRERTTTQDQFPTEKCTFTLKRLIIKPYLLSYFSYNCKRPLLSYAGMHLCSQTTTGFLINYKPLQWWVLKSLLWLCSHICFSQRASYGRLFLRLAVQLFFFMLLACRLAGASCSFEPANLSSKARTAPKCKTSTWVRRGISVYLMFTFGYRQWTYLS